MMRKFILNSFYFLVLSLSAFSMREALADRGPSVEPFVEVDIENVKKINDNEKGYNFTNPNQVKEYADRKPAGIVSKSGSSSPVSYLGPILFLIALPFAIWIVIARKSSEEQAEDKADYYPKTFQFKPFKNEANKNDDDIDYPKAS